MPQPHGSVTPNLDIRKPTDSASNPEGATPQNTHHSALPPRPSSTAFGAGSVHRQQQGLPPLPAGTEPRGTPKGQDRVPPPSPPMTLPFIHGPVALPRLGSKVGGSLLGKVKSRGWFPERPLDHRPNRGCFLLTWGLRPCQAISPNPVPRAREQRAQQLLLTSSSPSRPGGWSAGRRRGRCPGKRASQPRRPQLLEGSRTPSTPITAPRAQQTSHFSPQMLRPSQCAQLAAPQLRQTLPRFLLHSCCSLCRNSPLSFFLKTPPGLNLQHTAGIL